jgi:hypothetical protein
MTWVIENSYLFPSSENTFAFVHCRSQFDIASTYRQRLTALDTDMKPTMDFNWLLYGAVAMIIGGVGAYTAVLLVVNYQLPFLLVLLVAMLLSGLLILIVSIIALRTIGEFVFWEFKSLCFR